MDFKFDRTTIHHVPLIRTREMLQRFQPNDPFTNHPLIGFGPCFRLSQIRRGTIEIYKRLFSRTGPGTQSGKDDQGTIGTRRMGFALELSSMCVLASRVRKDSRGAQR